MRRRIVLAGLCVGVALGCLGGCGSLLPEPDPPAEAVLEGTWLVEIENAPDLKQLLVTFDEKGNLQSVTYQIADSAVLTVPSPVGDADVTGNTVSLSFAFNGNTVAFTGTLNGAGYQMTGSITSVISVGSSIVTINNGPATLTKQ